MSASGSRVEQWLHAGSEVGSEVGESVRGGGSEYGEPFDESKYLLREEEEQFVGADAADCEVVEGALGEVARAAQRKAVGGFHRHFVRGRMLDIPRYDREVERPQRFFRLEGFVQLESLDDTTLIDRLSQGIVRTRLGAHTGMGKTMKLPGLLASKCGLRVCQLELDSHIAKKAMAFQRKLYNLPGSVTSWSRTKKAFLACMSYDEFRGIVLSGNRERLFKDFDVFYMDEAHEPLAAVWVARHYFATFAEEHNSLIVASATVSTVEQNNVAAVNVGRFKSEVKTLSLEAAMDGGQLLTTHLRDRAVCLVASDEAVAAARAYYLENGLDVKILDSASTDADVDAVVKFLASESSVVPRVLVATQNYGTSYNLPLTYVISTCTRQAFEMNASHALVEREVPLMQKSVVQHQGRVGRGITTGGGGWLMCSEPSPDKELMTSEALEAYLSLVAASIKPRPGLFDAVTKVLPRGVDAGVARRVLRVGLPPALTVRYLGTDGLFASSFVDGVRLFTQSGEGLRKSRDKLPVGYNTWTDERVGNYYVGDESATPVLLRVPFASPPGLKVAMHAIAAVSEHLINVDYWDWHEDEVESEDEYTGVRSKVVRIVKPRMPEAPEVRVRAPTVTSESSVWAYDADPLDAAKRMKRRAMSWDANGEGKTAVKSLLRALESHSLGISVAMPELAVPEYDGQVAYSLPLEEHVMVPVTSPGGGKIMLVAQQVHDAFMSGAALTPADAVKVLQMLIDIKAVDRFAKSTVFDNWSPAWLCWFGTFADVETVEAWKKVGRHSEAFKLLGFLYDRFRSEVVSVSLSSNVYKDKVGSIFRSKPSITKMVNAAKRGRLPVAQSDVFVARVIDIKDAYDNAIMSIESVGVFVPGQVTNAQRRLPLRDKNRRMPVIDERVVEMGKVSLSDGVGRNWRS